MSAPQEVRRWYVLVIAGQSNAQGFGEAMPEPDDLQVSQRIKQLGRYRGIRPDGQYEDRWNQLVEPSHALDDVKDMRFCNLTGNTDLRRSGTVGPGLFIARRLLPLLPDDAGILLLPQAHGGAGMNYGDPGSYIAAAACGPLEQPGASIGRCVANYADLAPSNTQGAMLWWGVQGAAAPLYRDLRDRLRFALSANPDNRLLGFVWVQGESDAHAGEPYASSHCASFGTMVDTLGQELADLRPQFLAGAWEQVPWINVLATHWWDEAIAPHRKVIDGYRLLMRQRPRQMCLLDVRLTEQGTTMETNQTHFVAPHSEGYPSVPASLVTDGRSCEPEMIHIHLSSGAYRGEVSRRIAQALQQRCFDD
ncbi:sialate O-acetylesterase [Duganella qianjiadongensis]|uniref:Sialate O-acetylesterase domain-containing protein n=1 Tax=Duganella qianjiadongensis TaxID=2692176 RepID=A0ABW9VGY8_9BURK|nr:sialate O-acetylesterase [Duganella qianjiadongensis]MYM37930.1 hypothetical protein [Duganella qianjiadongensis]